jgi:hypothetical protein
MQRGFDTATFLFYALSKAMGFAYNYRYCG